MDLLPMPDGRSPSISQQRFTDLSTVEEGSQPTSSIASPSEGAGPSGTAEQAGDGGMASESLNRAANKLEQAADRFERAVTRLEEVVDEIGTLN